MSIRLRHLVAVAGAAALLAGCGSNDDERGPGIPSSLVQQINTQLDLVQERIEVTRDTDRIGSCQDVERKSIPDIERLIAQVPDNTDPEIVDALDKGIDRLRDLASQECSELEDQIPETETTPEETVPPETVTETVPQETTPETTPEEEKPKGKDKKDDGGDGGTTPPDDGGGGALAPLPGEGD